MLRSRKRLTDVLSEAIIEAGYYNHHTIAKHVDDNMVFYEAKEKGYHISSHIARKIGNFSWIDTKVVAKNILEQLNKSEDAKVFIEDMKISKKDYINFKFKKAYLKKTRKEIQSWNPQKQDPPQKNTTKTSVQD